MTIRQHPSASFLPSTMDKVIDIPDKKDDTDDISLDKKLDSQLANWSNENGGINSQEKAELESKLRSLFRSNSEDHNSAYIRKVLDLMFQDMERKSRPRYG